MEALRYQRLLILFGLLYFVVPTYQIEQYEVKTLANYIYVTNDLIFSYEIGLDDITMQFSSSFDGWVGLGFGSGMKNLDVYQAYAVDGTSAKVIDEWSTGYSQPPEDTSLGGKDNVLLPTLSMDGN